MRRERKRCDGKPEAYNYWRHKRRGEKPCDTARLAWNARQRRVRQQKRLKRV